VVVVPGDIVQVDLALQPSPGTLTGTVTGGNQPVSGASVAVQQQGVTVATTTTNSAGVFTIQLAAGTYTVVVTGSGFQQVSQANVAIVSDETTSLTFTLTAVPPGSLVGLIALQGSTAPVAGVTVNLITAGAIVRTTTVGKASRRWRHLQLPLRRCPGRLYDVQISATGSAPRPRRDHVTSAGYHRVTSRCAAAHLRAGLSMTSAPFDYAPSADIQR